MNENNGNRRTIVTIRPRKHLKLNPRKNHVASLKNKIQYKDTISIQNTKQIRPEKKICLPHSNQNSKHTEQINNIKSCKEKGQVTYDK